MLLEVIRYGFTETHTKGLLFIDGVFFCHTLEDKVRMKKVHSKTAIPTGEYRLLQRCEDTPLTFRYRNLFSWFNYHWQIQDVPGFDYIYIHIGNNNYDTDGCLLVGMGAGTDVILNSQKAYTLVYDLLKESNEHTIIIKNL